MAVPETRRRGDKPPLRPGARAGGHGRRRKDDVQEAALTVVELAPLDGEHDPLVPATTLPAATLAAV
jgi:hypothetical protein